MQNNYTGQPSYKSYHIIMSRSDSRGHLLLGDFNSATDQQMLSKNDVKTIITAARGFEHLTVPNSYTHIVFPLADAKSENIRAYFDESNQIIEENLKRGGVLVHCGAGVSRSATLVIAYYMKKNKENFKNAIKYVKNIRSTVCPNLGFELQLKDYQIQLGLDPPKLQKKAKSSIASEGIKQSFNIPNNQTYHQSSHASHDKVQNKSVFNFHPNLKSNSSYRNSQKRAFPRQYPKSRPKEQTTNNFKKFYEVAETKLYVTGKGTSRPQQRNKDINDIKFNNAAYKNQSSYLKGSSTKEKNPLLGTWGPLAHKDYKIQM